MLSNTNRQMTKNMLDIVAKNTEERNFSLSLLCDYIGLKMSDNTYEYDRRSFTILNKLDKAYGSKNTYR